jgi:hypothetical protein
MNSSFATFVHVRSFLRFCSGVFQLLQRGSDFIMKLFGCFISCLLLCGNISLYLVCHEVFNSALYGQARLWKEAHIIIPHNYKICSKI